MGLLGSCLDTEVPNGNFVFKNQKCLMGICPWGIIKQGLKSFFNLMISFTLNGKNGLFESLTN